MTKVAKRTVASDRPESFQIKGGLFPMTLLDLKTSDLTAIASELREKVIQSPAFFAQSAIVIGLDQLDESEQHALDLEGIHALCRELKLLPTATRGGLPELAGRSFRLGLAVLPKGRKSNDTNPIFEPPPEAPAPPPTPAPAEVAHLSGQIITNPVRSGQQIYARGGDLIVMASVSAGAEVLADGHIHIYGPLRGRALAGVKGDESARIFCASQEAELVSIAGQYMVDDVLKNTFWKEPVQISLNQGRIQLMPMPKMGL